MSWENLAEIVDGLEVLQTYSEDDSAQNNRTGAVLGGGAALAAGVVLGAASLPLAVPLLVASGVFAGAKGEETVKNAAKGIGFLFGEVAKGIGGVLDVFKSGFFKSIILQFQYRIYGKASRKRIASNSSLS